MRLNPLLCGPELGSPINISPADTLTPLFLANAGPLFFGPKRFTEPALKLNEIPRTDIFLLTHNHYDHMSIRTIKNFPYKNTKVLVPLKLGKYFTQNSYKDVKEMDWYDEIKVNDFHLESLEFKCEISVSDSLTSGIIDMKAGAGTWRNRNFDSGTINATIRNSEIVIESCHFKSGDDYLQASGEYDGINQYLINQLQVVYQNHFLVNARPVSFSFQDSILNVDP